MASQTNPRYRNALVALFSPIKRPYPRLFGLNSLSITPNRYIKSQSSKSGRRHYSRHAGKREINQLRDALYIDTAKILGHLSRAGLEVRASGLMKGKDLGGCPYHETSLLLTGISSYARSYIDRTGSRTAPTASGL